MGTELASRIEWNAPSGGGGSGTGPPGPRGPMGPAGPPGPAGVGSPTHYPYEWLTATGIGDPTHGAMMGDAAPTLMTVLSASIYSVADQVVSDIRNLVVGDRFHLYLHGSLDTWNQYELAAASTSHGDQWIELPVTYIDSGPTTLQPASTTDIYFVFSAGVW